MIGYIAGRIVGSIGGQAIIATTSGIGYIVTTPPEQRLFVGDSIELYTLHIIREDRQELYGFFELKDRQQVEQLLKVDGVGPKTAATVVYTLGSEIIAKAIHTEDYKLFSQVKGLGTKTAKKIVLELKGASTDLTSMNQVLLNVDQEKMLSLIVSMGYKKQDAIEAITRASNSALFDIRDTKKALQQVLKELN